MLVGPTTDGFALCLSLIAFCVAGRESLPFKGGYVTANPSFFPWLRSQVQLGVGVLVIGGCTTTSCVRVSSQQIVAQLSKQELAGQVRVVVDLRLCGARCDNFEQTAERDPVDQYHPEI